MRKPISAVAGTSFRTSSSLFVSNSDVNHATPVATTPGRLRLVTKPMTGSSPARKTREMVALAAFASSAELMPVVTMTDGSR